MSVVKQQVLNCLKYQPVLFVTKSLSLNYKLTYKDMNDVSVTDFDYFRFAQSIVTTDDAGVKTEKYCLTYTPQPTWQSHGWRSLKIFACPVPNSKLYAIRSVLTVHFLYLCWFHNK